MAWRFVPGTDYPSAQAAEALIWASCSPSPAITPAPSSNGKPGPAPPSSRRKQPATSSGRRSRPISAASTPSRLILKERSRRRLNPLFVGWLMGWPIGHALCACSATEFTLWQQHMRGALSQVPMASGPWIWRPTDAAQRPAQMDFLVGLKP